MRSTTKAIGLCILLGLAAGCPKDKKGNEGPANPTLAEPPVIAVGRIDPFARLSAESAKQLSVGYKAMRGKKWDEAQAVFRAVAAAAPDYTLASWLTVRALVSGGNFKEVPSAFEGLLARDYPAWANKLDTAKEFQALRNAPEWTKIAELKTRYQSAYAKGLDKGFFFVARTHAADEVKFDATTNEGALALNQEIFHYDPETKRFRRLSETGGHAFAMSPSADSKTLAFLVASRIFRRDAVQGFVDPRVGAIELGTLTTVGPFVQKGQYDQVVLSTNRAGQPIFMFVTSTGAAKTYGIDTARTGLAELSGDATIPAAGETRAWPEQVLHLTGRAIPGVKITDGANSFQIENGGTVTAARPLAQSSLDWSPGHARLTYAGKLDACKILKGDGTDKNELYVYDLGKRTAQRVASAVSAFETLWLDDDHLVYEGGVGKDGKIHLYAFVAHADSTLPTRNGAGLYGVPSLQCEQAEPAGDEDLGDADEGD